MPALDPPHDCPLCPRLAAFRNENRAKFPDWFNGPVPNWGDREPKLIIVGLAPGLRGANRTGRPFTGDYAGDLLYKTLLKFGLATGEYAADPNDSLQLQGVMIGNGVRCVAAWLHRAGALALGEQVMIESPSGPVTVRLLDAHEVTVDMGEPRFEPGRIPLVAEAGTDRHEILVGERKVEFGAVSMGNPHAVVSVADLARTPIKGCWPSTDATAPPTTF